MEGYCGNIRQMRAFIYRHALFTPRFRNILHNIVEIDTIAELEDIFSWEYPPILDNPEVYAYHSSLDENRRPLRDAECIGAVMRNSYPHVALEIGTAMGQTTALMSMNAPDSHIFTVNILPEEIHSGAAGVYTTIDLDREQIGSYYRGKKMHNITQIYANTAEWEPDIGFIDVAFIDGCHDADFVYQDTRKILHYMKPGSILLWHDFHPGLARQHSWIFTVFQGIERLFREKIIRGPIFHVRDSWVGIYQVR
jgi:predicted O-methyltransferase YrrM